MRPQSQKQPPPATIGHRRFSSGATHLSLVPVITTLTTYAFGPHAIHPQLRPRAPRRLLTLPVADAVFLSVCSIGAS
ncbi:hypothetical protein LX32DRAFT_645945 [Colletotrichum zoysiae]|uniref:Uncharacterized protein n=1 Tax=Colletotrichum zoysiae TaxID=1216348 RepID=A0AAD9LVF4_9PEZI|nr:hypothetical protein LX32DRAFT_645945 [Colletotrichum zoysiae]